MFIKEAFERVKRDNKWDDKQLLDKLREAGVYLSDTTYTKWQTGASTPTKKDLVDPLKKFLNPLLEKHGRVLETPQKRGTYRGSRMEGIVLPGSKDLRNRKPP